MKIIINADDFGYTKANTEGIIEGYKKGIIKSTTALMNMSYIEYGEKIAAGCSNLGIGVHLVLTLGKSLTENKTLTDKDGNFFNRKEIINHKLDLQEICLEFKAQIERYIKIFGHKPSHLDSHHGMHDYGNHYTVVKRLSEEYDLPVRNHNQFHFVTEFYGSNVSQESFIFLLDKYKDKDIEIMTHPGYCDLELYRKSSYSVQRIKELDILCSQEVKDYINSHNIIITNYLGK